MIYRIAGALILSIIAFVRLKGQDVEMADAFRAEGKIYVVVAVVLIILIGLMLYLIKMDRKIKKLEEE